MSSEQLAVSKGEFRSLGVSAISAFISILIFDLQIYNLSELTNSPRRFSFPPLIRYTATSLLIAHCSLLIASHHNTATFIAIACRQYYKKKSALSPITTFPLWESAY